MNKTFWDRILGKFQTRPEYNNDGLQELIDEQIPHKPRICDTEKDVIITSFDVDNYKPLFFKSFKDKRNIILKDALCMSSAAPAYFPTYHNKEQNIYGIDGGITANDPTDCAYAESLKLYGKDADIKILSIGTGHTHEVGIGEKSICYGGIEWVTKGDLLDLVFKAPQLAVNYKMKVFTEALGHSYLHLNGDISKSCNMDDTSEENIQYFRQMGDKWWEEFGKETIEFLKS